jgi:hypothetical protein
MQNGSTGSVVTGVYRAVIVAVAPHARSTVYTPADMQQQAPEAGIPSIHSCDYREPSAYAGKSVLIGHRQLGSGDSHRGESRRQRTMMAEPPRRG